MKHVKNLSIWLMGLAISIISSISIMYLFDDTMYRIKETDIPENGTAFLMGGFFGALFGAAFNIFVFIVFLIFLFGLKAEVKFKYFLLRGNESIALKVIHIIGYAIMILFAFDYVKNLFLYHDFILSEIIFYLASIITTAFYTILLCSLINSGQQTDDVDISV